jgi:hypothetical protein
MHRGSIVGRTFGNYSDRGCCFGKQQTVRSHTVPSNSVVLVHGSPMRGPQFTCCPPRFILRSAATLIDYVYYKNIPLVLYSCLALGHMKVGDPCLSTS